MVQKQQLAELADGAVNLHRQLVEFNNSPGDFNRDDQPSFDRILAASKDLETKAKAVQKETGNDSEANIPTPNDPDANAQRLRTQPAKLATKPAKKP